MGLQLCPLAPLFSWDNWQSLSPIGQISRRQRAKLNFEIFGSVGINSGPCTGINRISSPQKNNKHATVSILFQISSQYSEHMIQAVFPGELSNWRISSTTNVSVQTTISNYRQVFNYYCYTSITLSVPKTLPVSCPPNRVGRVQTGFWTVTLR